MKNQKVLISTAIKPLALAVSVAGVALCVPNARAQFSLGDAANYAVLYEGNGDHNLQINSNPLPTGTIDGNIGLGNGVGGTGNPTAQLNNPAVINGNVNFASAQNPGNSNVGNAVIHGSVNYGVTQVESDLTYLNNLSTTLGGESGAALAISGNTTVNAADGNIIAGNSIFLLSSLSLGNGNVLTIMGDGHDSVVINIPASVGGLHFAGAIDLVGLTANEVLINIIGGNTLQTAANGATQTVTYLDPNGTININSVNIDGHVYGGDTSDMQIVSGGTVTAPAAVPEVGSTGLIQGSFVLLLMGGSAAARAYSRARQARS